MQSRYEPHSDEILSSEQSSASIANIRQNQQTTVTFYLLLYNFS